MINEKVLDFLNKKGFADRIHEHKETIDTVEHASEASGWCDVCNGWEE